MKFGIAVLHKKLPSMREFCENRFIGSHALVKCVNEVLLYLSHLLVEIRYRSSSQKVIEHV